ncbi:MAG: penicillin-binding protein 2 [Bacteroidetes bacterium]|nr:penicillin-binding protein 2 [Bacteroidota bacterium]
MNNLSDRKVVIAFIFLIIGLIFILRLFYVQIINNKYKIDSDQNVLREVIQYPARGLIYDRNGVLLVYNEAAYDLMVVPRLVKEIDTLEFCQLLGIKLEDFRTKFYKARDYSRYKPSVFEKEISSKEYAKIQEKLFAYPGFYAQTRTLRKYPRESAAHVLGYIGEVNQKIIDNDSYYKSGDYIGKSGIELSYESLLRGKRGVKRVLVDVHNREKGSYMDGELDTMAVTGETIYLSIDAIIQEYGEKLMQNKRGSIVAIEPETGEILALVSAPAYNPNLLVGRDVKKNYPVLSNDELKPLFNRALMASYPPGSTFKTVQALIALQDGVINEQTGFPCIKSNVGCHNHPTATDVVSSIKMSCNPYYFSVFRKILLQNKSTSLFKDSEIGLAQWSKQVKKFGLGVRLETDLPSIQKGFIPDVDFYDKWYGKGRWAFSTIYSLSIGQGEIGVVPLQMANLSTILANRGYFYTPHLLKRIEKTDTIPSIFKIKHQVGVEAKYFTPIVEGMLKVVEEAGGTARRAKIDSIQVCGKTGTAQNPHGEDHSIFIAFAPKDNPKIAIAVYIENAGFGGTWAAPIASLIMEKYLKGSIKDLEKEKRILEANLMEVVQKKNKTSIH